MLADPFQWSSTNVYSIQRYFADSKLPVILQSKGVSFQTRVIKNSLPWGTIIISHEQTSLRQVVGSDCFAALDVLCGRKVAIAFKAIASLSISADAHDHLGLDHKTLEVLNYNASVLVEYLQRRLSARVLGKLTKDEYIVIFFALHLVSCAVSLYTQKTVCAVSFSRPGC
jgi:hypothetical protein